MWILLSMLASILWGLVYVLDEQIYKHISVITALAIASFFGFVSMTILAVARGEFVSDLRALGESREAMIILLLLVLVFVAAELCIGFSISSSNATLAALIEISYPFFTALFAAILFKVNHFTLSTIIGGLLIGSGVAVISWANR